MVKLRVSDVMTKKPIVVKSNLSVEDGAKLMIKNGVGNLMIVENDILKGIVTEKDFVEKVIAKCLDPKKTKISEIMSSKITATITPDKDIIEALRIMNDKKIRRLPVTTKEGKLTGILTEKDIIKIQPELINLRLDSYSLKEEKLKPSRFVDGECEDCGSFTMLEKIGTKLICSECKFKKYYN